MKITGKRVEGFLADPDPAIACVLLFGPDQGLVAERADALVRVVVDDPADPFRVTDLSSEAVRRDPAALGDEVSALALSGGSRAVRVRDASDGLAAAFKDLFGQTRGGALVVVEAGDLRKGSSLRKLFEQAEDAAAIPCYADDERNLSRVIGDILREHGLSASPDVIAYLVEHLGADRMVTRRELEKLALYKGEPGAVSLEDAMVAVGDAAATSLEAVALAVAAGDNASLDRALARAFLEGTSAVAVLRATARHFLRLHRAAGSLAAGESPERAMAALRPPVLFTIAERFRHQMTAWSPNRLAAALDLLGKAELDCKSTGQPPEAVCGRALMRLAHAARRPESAT